METFIMWVLSLDLTVVLYALVGTMLLLVLIWFAQLGGR